MYVVRICTCEHAAVVTRASTALSWRVSHTSCSVWRDSQTEALLACVRARRAHPRNLPHSLRGQLRPRFPANSNPRWGEFSGCRPSQFCVAGANGLMVSPGQARFNICVRPGRARLLWARPGQVMSSGQVMSGQVAPGEATSSQARPGQVRLLRVRSRARPGLVRRSHIKSGEAGLVRARSDQMPGQALSVQPRSSEVALGQVRTLQFGRDQAKSRAGLTQIMLGQAR